MLLMLVFFPMDQNKAVTLIHDSIGTSPCADLDHLLGQSVKAKMRVSIR